METEAVNMHDQTGELTKDLKLEAGKWSIIFDTSRKWLIFFLGDDAAKVKWVRLDRNHNLYAGHELIIQAVIKKRGAYEYWH